MSLVETIQTDGLLLESENKAIGKEDVTTTTPPAISVRGRK